MIYTIRTIISRLIQKRKLKKKNVLISLTDNISHDTVFEGMNQIFPHATFSGYLGFGSYIASGCVLNAKIGRFTCIAPNVRSNNGVHPMYPPFVTIAPCFYSMNPFRAQNGGTFAKRQMFEEFVTTKDGYGIEIGNDVWICENVFINGGVHIADGAVVLAGAVVTKDVPPYSIWGGVPAKQIGYRFDKGTIDFILRTKWWNNDETWFKEHWDLLCDINKFKSYYRQLLD